MITYAQLHFTISNLPMEFIPMDVIALFDPSSKGHKCNLTEICILTAHTFCIPLNTKTATEVVQA